MTSKGGNVPSSQTTRGFDNADIPASTLREVKKLNRAARLMQERQSKPRNCKPIVLKNQSERAQRNKRKRNSRGAV
jgi:hypothetical protein